MFPVYEILKTIAIRTNFRKIHQTLFPKCSSQFLFLRTLDVYRKCVNKGSLLPFLKHHQFGPKFSKASSTPKFIVKLNNLTFGRSVKINFFQIYIRILIFSQSQLPYPRIILVVCLIINDFLNP